MLNPRKAFNFRISFPNQPTLPVFACQTVTIPDETVEQIEHGTGNSRIKTAGQYIAGEATIGMIIPASKAIVSPDLNPNNFFRNWQRSAQDPILGGGSDPFFYKRTTLVEELANDGATVLNSYLLVGAWPTKINGREYSRTESNNTVETVELSTDAVPYI